MKALGIATPLVACWKALAIGGRPSAVAITAHPIKFDLPPGGFRYVRSGVNDFTEKLEVYASTYHWTPPELNLGGYKENLLPWLNGEAKWTRLADELMYERWCFKLTRRWVLFNDVRRGRYIASDVWELSSHVCRRPIS